MKTVTVFVVAMFQVTALLMAILVPPIVALQMGMTELMSRHAVPVWAAPFLMDEWELPVWGRRERVRELARILWAVHSSEDHENEK